MENNTKTNEQQLQLNDKASKDDGIKRQLLLSSSGNYLKIIMQQNNNNYKKNMNYSSYTISSSLILIEVYIKLIQLIITLVMQKQQEQQIIIKININKSKTIHKMQIKQIQINYYDTLFSNGNHNNKLLTNSNTNQQKHINNNIITIFFTLPLTFTLKLNLFNYLKNYKNCENEIKLSQHPMDNEEDKNYYYYYYSESDSGPSLDCTWSSNYYCNTHDAADAVVGADFAADIGYAIIEKCSRIFLE